MRALVAIILCALAGYAWSDTFKSATVFVSDVSGSVIVDKNSTTIRPIASITKLMVAVVVVEAGLPLDDTITITARDAVVATLRKQQTGRSLGVGTTLTRRQMMHTMLTNSHNRAAAALARTYPGGISAAIAAMNAKAKQLGMVDTTYFEPTGLNSKNTSTARDLAILVQYSSHHKAIRKMSTTSYVSIPRKTGKPMVFGTTNAVIRSKLWDGVRVQKTGFIGPSGFCAVLYVRTSLSKYTVIVLDAPTAFDRTDDLMIIKHQIIRLEAGIAR